MTSADRLVRTRRIVFRYSMDDLPKHYVGGDLVMSHVVSLLSSLFPEGEDFFVRTVRNYRLDVTDPELKKQVGGFIGQEAIHGREHRAFNERLHTLGYPTQRIERFTGMALRFAERTLPRDVQLAVTAALEHYTATLAEVLLTDPEARAMFTSEEVRSLFLWHALEESEHKAVAFDVFQHVSGDYRVRTWVMHATTAGFLGAVVVETALSLLGDREAWRPNRLLSSLWRLRRSPWLARDVRRHIRDYHRHDFHPDDRGTAALVERWRAELFGADGTLLDRLQGAAG